MKEMNSKIVKETVKEDLDASNEFLNLMPRNTQYHFMNSSQCGGKLLAVFPLPHYVAPF